MHRLSAGARVWLAAGVGVAAGVIASVLTLPQAAALLGWDAGAAVFLSWVWFSVARLDAEATGAAAVREDTSAATADLLVVASGVALLAAVGLALLRAGHSGEPTKAYLIGLGVLSVALTWAVVHTVFTLRYARLYYDEPAGGVEFNESDRPTYLDFAYLAFTIGMTFQVSDTNISSKTIRREALRHALLSYVFGAVIVALAINVVASLL
jgi:uncharacterized membrane protein